MATFDKVVDRVLSHEGLRVSSAEIKSALDSALCTASAMHVQLGPRSLNSRAYDCSEGCGRPAYAGGLCNAHYLRKRQGKEASLPIRNRRAAHTCIQCTEPQTIKGGLGRCPKHYRIFRRAELKRAAVAVMGGCCQSCSGVFHIAAYDFHHLGVKTDHPSVLFVSGSTQRIADELSQCVLLCANCHRIEHSHV